MREIVSPLDGFRSPFAQRVGGGASYSVSIGSGDVVTGTELTATVSGLVGGETVTYQWQDDGVNIAGRTLSTYSPTIGTDSVADASLIRCVVTVDGGDPIPSSTRRVIYAAGSFGALSNQSFTDDTGNQTYVFPAATGTGLTWTYSLVSPPSGVTINSGTRTITFDTNALAVQSGTVITVRAVDQYGRNPGDQTFTLAITEPVAASASFEGDATGTAFGTSLTFNSASTNQTALPATFTAGKKLVAVNEGNGGTVTGVTIDGVAATNRATQGSLSFWEATITGNTTNNIVVTISAGTNRVAVAMWDVTGMAFQSSDFDTPADTSPRTATAQFTTSAGDAVMGAWWSVATTPTYTAGSGETLRTDDLGNNGRFITAIDNLNTTGGSPEDFSLTASTAFTGATLLAVHYA